MNGKRGKRVKRKGSEDQKSAVDWRLRRISDLDMNVQNPDAPTKGDDEVHATGVPWGRKQRCYWMDGQ
jgi:hypothetical protein